MNCCRKLELNISGGKPEYNLSISTKSVNAPIPHKVGGKELELDENLYKQILLKFDPNNEPIMQALKIVKKYIIREKLILTGGMAIDFALRLRGSKLYSNDEIPDYDFISPKHWVDAYEITRWLTKTGYQNISTINALHPTTMRVRLYSVAVADCTYVPQNIYDVIPRLNYHGFDFVHPYYQYLDQHRALSYAYEHINFDRPIRPVIVSRWMKDMKRYDLLWSKYPLKWEGNGSHVQSIKLENEKTVPNELIAGQCISGFLALQYWINWAEKKGFKSNQKFGKFEHNDSGIAYIIPTDSHGISLYTNNIAELYSRLKSAYKPKEIRFYTRFLDKLPRKIILDNEWELLDNHNNWIAAHKVGAFHVANMQLVMLYMLLNYMLLNKMYGENRGYAFYAGYMMCRELVKFGADNVFEELLPSAEYYGVDIYSEAYLLMKNKQMEKIQNTDIPIPTQPHNVYERDSKPIHIPRTYYDFNPEDSELFQMDGKQCKKFI